MKYPRKVAAKTSTLWNNAGQPADSGIVIAKRPRQPLPSTRVAAPSVAPAAADLLNPAQAAPVPAAIEPAKPSALRWRKSRFFGVKQG